MFAKEYALSIFWSVLAKVLAPAISVVLTGGLPVVVTKNDGQVMKANWEGCSAQSLKLEVGGVVSEVPFDDLLSLEPANLESRTGPRMMVTLVGGSVIAAQELSSKDDELTIQPRRQTPILIPFKQVKAIRFRAASVTTDPLWLGMLASEKRGDTLVIRRDGDRLDPQQGLVTSVSDEKIGFDLAGTVVNAPVDRLEGVVFGGNEKAESGGIQITDVFGSKWSVISIDPAQAGDPLLMNLVGSIKHTLPLNQIESIRWSGGVRMLAGEEAAVKTYQPFLVTSIDADLQAALFGPSVEGSEDLVMHGGSSVEYRIEPDFRIFSGIVGRHENVSRAGSVTVRVTLDGKTVWEQALENSELRGFELPIANARRLAIEVDSDGDGDLGDTVRIARPRLLK